MLGHVVVSIPGASLLNIDRKSDPGAVTISCPSCKATATVPVPDAGPVRVTTFDHQDPCGIADRVARALASGRSLRDTD